MNIKKYKTFLDFLEDDNIILRSNINENINIDEKIIIYKNYCLICKKKFKRKDYLKRHNFGIHEKKDIYKCNYCKKYIKRKDNFNIHLISRCKENNNKKNSTHEFKKKITGYNIYIKDCFSILRGDKTTGILKKKIERDIKENLKKKENNLKLFATFWRFLNKESKNAYNNI